MRTRSLAAALLTVAPFALVGAYAFAHGSLDDSAARATEVTSPPQADVRPFEHAKLSLVQAVTDAQKEMRGNILEAQARQQRLVYRGTGESSARATAGRASR